MNQLAALNGWQRLWLVFFGIWMIAVLGYLLPDLPTYERQQTAAMMTKSPFRELFDEPQQEIDCNGLEFKEMMFCVSERRRKSDNLAQQDRDAASRALAELEGTWEMVLAKYIGATLCLAILPPLLLYAAGLAVAWIRRGFQKPA